VSTNGAQHQQLAIIPEDHSSPMSNKELVKQSVSMMMRSKTLKAMDQQVGDPKVGESLDDYLNRAKAVAFDFIEKSLR
jgi:hypothetical protein